MTTKRRIKEYSIITVGVLVMSLGFHYLIIPNELVPGGVSGIAVILRELLGYNPSLIILVANVFLLLLGLIFLGKDFFAKTVYSSILFPGALFALEQLSIKFQLTYVDDLFLVAVFGAISIGMGLGMVLRYGGTTGGVDIPQRILQKYLNIPFSVSIYIIDGIIILAGISVFGVKAGMYAIIIMYLSGVVVDKVLVGGKNRKAVYIITNKPQEITNRIFNHIKRGASQMEVLGSYSREKRDMIVVVLEHREYYILRNVVIEEDPSAFVFVSNASEVVGEGFTR